MEGKFERSRGIILRRECGKTERFCPYFKKSWGMRLATGGEITGYCNLETFQKDSEKVPVWDSDEKRELMGTLVTVFCGRY